MGHIAAARWLSRGRLALPHRALHGVVLWQRLLDLLAAARRPLVVLDFETAGLGGAPPVEFAALVFSPWEVQVDDEETRRAAALVPPGLTYAVQMRLDPLRPIDPGATRVHRIRDEDVRGKTPYNDLEVVGFFLGYASGDAADGVGPAVWVGHNAAGADVPWAQRWNYLPDADLDIVDTMRVVRRMQREMPFPLAHDILTPVASPHASDVGNHSVVKCVYDGLDAYASSLTGAHVALLGERPAESHGAMADCQATSRVLCRLLDLWSPMWPAGRLDVPASTNLGALLAALDAPEPGRVSWDGWLAEDESRLQGTGYVWTKGKFRGQPAHRDQWVMDKPRRPTGVDGEWWCSQHTADILSGLRPMAVAR